MAHKSKWNASHDLESPGVGTCQALSVPECVSVESSTQRCSILPGVMAHIIDSTIVVTCFTCVQWPTNHAHTAVFRKDISLQDVSLCHVQLHRRGTVLCHQSHTVVTELLVFQGAGSASQPWMLARCWSSFMLCL